MNGGKDYDETSQFVPSDERPCPEIRFGFDHHQIGPGEYVARYTVLTIRYVSAVDGKSHRLNERQLQGSAPTKLPLGQKIALRAHKSKADVALIDHWP